MIEKEAQNVNVIDTYQSLIKHIILAAISIFIAEAIAMTIIENLPMSEWMEVMLDSLLLVILISPVLFFFFFRPFFLYASERKRVEKELTDSGKHLQYLSSKLLGIQEQERMRISRELHDELGQSLTLLKLRVRFVEKHLTTDQAMLRGECESILTYIDQTIENVQRISKDLSPMILEDCGLSAALNQMANKFIKHSNMDVSLDIGDIEHLFPRKDHIVVYRIFQEALTNAGKHSGATSVLAVLKEENGRFVFQVKDNGKGFKPEQVAEKCHGTKGIGLATMKERARMLGGSLDLWSQEGKGTQISFSIPLTNKSGEIS